MLDTDTPLPEDFGDIPEEFHPVVRQYGRELFAFVMNVGMSGQAAQTLAVFAEKHRSTHSLHALHVLTQAFNATGSALAEKMGWTEELIAQCDRDVLLAAKAKIELPKSSIILPH